MAEVEIARFLEETQHVAGRGSAPSVERWKAQTVIETRDLILAVAIEAESDADPTPPPVALVERDTANAGDLPVQEPQAKRNVPG